MGGRAISQKRKMIPYLAILSALLPNSILCLYLPPDSYQNLMAFTSCTLICRTWWTRTKKEMTTNCDWRFRYSLQYFDLNYVPSWAIRHVTRVVGAVHAGWHPTVAINPSESIFSKPQCDIVILFIDTDEERNAKVMVFHYFHGVFQFLARFRLSLYDEVENGHKLILGL